MSAARLVARCVVTVVAAAALIAVALGSAAPSPGAPFPLRLGARLRAAGRAECGFVRAATDPWTDRPTLTRGRIVLELPDRARLEFPSTGERITLRGDGGEWLQPRLRQLVVFPPERAREARRWWQLLIDGSAPGIEVSRRTGRRLVLRSARGAGPDSASLDLDAAGLPTRLRAPDAGGPVEYRFARWSFGRARGDSAFRQRAPAEFERVELP